MNNFVFCIPSYKRAFEQLTLDYLESMEINKERIYISTQTKDDFKEYSEKYGQRANIIYNEGTCVGDNRNNILNNFKEGTKIVMLDDDLKFIGKLQNKKLVPFEKEELLNFNQRKNTIKSSN